MHADDNNFLLRSANVPFALEASSAVLNRVMQWCQENGLIVNLQKTEGIFFSLRKCNPMPLTIGNNENKVKAVDSVRFLGVTLDRYLRWDVQLDELRKRLNSVTYMLFMLRDQVTYDILKILYYSSYQSLLSYGVIFWGCSSFTQGIFVSQKSALRTMLKLGFRQSCRGHFRNHYILTVYGLYIYRLLLFFHKQSDYFAQFKNTNNTRQMCPYHYPSHSTILRERGPEYMAIRLFCGLPKHLQGIADHKVIKRRIHETIIQCEPYSVNEFLTFCNAI